MINERNIKKLPFFDAEKLNIEDAYWRYKTIFTYAGKEGEAIIPSEFDVKFKDDSNLQNRFLARTSNYGDWDEIGFFFPPILVLFFILLGVIGLNIEVMWFAVTSFSLSGLITLYGVDNFYNDNYKRYKIINKTSNCYDDSLFFSPILNDLVQHHKCSVQKLTENEVKFIHLVNCFRANKTSVPYYDVMMSYLERVEYNYSAKCRNKEKYEAGKELGLVVKKVNKLFGKYFVNPVEYDNSIPRYEFVLTGLARKYKNKKTNNKNTPSVISQEQDNTRPLNTTDSNSDDLLSITSTRELFTVNDSPTEKFDKLIMSLSALSIPQENIEAVILSNRAKSVFEEYSRLVSVAIETNNTSVKNTLDNEIHAMLDKLGEDYQQLVLNIENDKIQVFNYNWSMLKDNESSLNLPMRKEK